LRAGPVWPGPVYSVPLRGTVAEGWWRTELPAGPSLAGSRAA